MTGAWFGFLAACLTTGAWIPQLVRTWRLRSAHDLSWAYLGTMMCGLTAWLIYGLSRHDVAIIGANIVSLTLVVMLSSFKAISDRRTPIPVPTEQSRD